MTRPSLAIFVHPVTKFLIGGSSTQENQYPVFQSMWLVLRTLPRCTNFQDCAAFPGPLSPASCLFWVGAPLSTLRTRKTCATRRLQCHRNASTTGFSPFSIQTGPSYRNNRILSETGLSRNLTYHALGTPIPACSEWAYESILHFRGHPTWFANYPLCKFGLLPKHLRPDQPSCLW